MLEAVLNDFTQWRKTRKKRCAIPDELWQKTFSLLNKYPISKICSALALNPSQIKVKMTAPTKNNVDTSKPFAEVVVYPNYVEPNNGVSVKIVRQDGATLCINALPYTTIKTLVDDFLVAK
jgi:hypothetical protein